MRLLQRQPDGSLIFTKDLDEDELPPYAILSHTWGSDEDEVSCQDFVSGDGSGKAGYYKLLFCAEQARRDGLEHFWADTCCIDKTNNVELNTAITSMFTWYTNAKVCYVYLPDVTLDDTNNWESDFRKSRWLTRGWTLQEMLAPNTVEFYDRKGCKLGDKSTLERHLCDITGIPAAALRGIRSLSSFTIEERFSWQRTRNTRKPEDRAYSLMGICGVSMVPIYGEGGEKAMARLRRDIDIHTKGHRHQDFSLPFADTGMVGVDTFVGRESELEKVHTSLTGDGICQTIVVHGLGGMGKTQLAIAYAKRYKDSYSAIFWLDIRDEASIKQSFVGIARRILLSHKSARHLAGVNLTGDLDTVKDAVLAWLGEPENTRWLAIYDNYDNPKIRGNKDAAAVDIRKFLPEAYQGSVIITTRSSQVKLGKQLSMPKMKDLQESIDILSSRSGRDLSVDDPDVLTLVQKLDGLPLALATTGAYLDQVSVTVSEYLRFYETSWSELHEDDPGLDTYEDRTLFTTWNISLAHLRQQNQLSAKLLGLWCYFSNQDLWFELLCDGDTDEVPWLKELTKSHLAFTEAMRVLCSHGLVEAGVPFEDHFESVGYSIHACVHLWTRHVLNKQWDATLAEFAISAVGYHVPYHDDKQWWVTQRRLLTHAQGCLLYLPDIHSRSFLFIESLRYIGYMYHQQGKSMDAEALLLRALKDSDVTPEAVNRLRPRIMNSLGLLYMDQRRFEETETMYLRSLRECEEVHGVDSEETLPPLNNLGLLYQDQGKMEEAEEMLRRALCGNEKLRGAGHLLTLNIVDHFGIMYVKQSKFQQAEEMYLRALRGKEEIVGPRHVSTLNTINNLGKLYLHLGRIEQAETLLKRAIEGYKTTLGEKHERTLSAITELGTVHKTQGNLEQAETMYLEALQGEEEVLGEKHPLTLITMYNLGVLYGKQDDRLEDAREMFLRTLQGQDEVLGPNHEKTLDAVYELGHVCFRQMDLENARDMFLRALEGYEKVLGPKHERTFHAFYELGCVYHKQNDLENARKMFLRALGGYEEVLGPKNCYTIDTVYWLGHVYLKQKDLDNAREMLSRAVKGYEEVLGECHMSTVRAVHDLGAVHYDLGDLQRAKELYLRALSGYQDSEEDCETDISIVQRNLRDLGVNEAQISRPDECQRSSTSLSGTADTDDLRNGRTAIAVEDGVLVPDETLQGSGSDHILGPDSPRTQTDLQQKGRARDRKTRRRRRKLELRESLATRK